MPILILGKIVYRCGSAGYRIFVAAIGVRKAVGRCIEHGFVWLCAACKSLRYCYECRPRGWEFGRELFYDLLIVSLCSICYLRSLIWNNPRLSMFRVLLYCLMLLAKTRLAVPIEVVIVLHMRKLRWGFVDVFLHCSYLFTVFCQIEKLLPIRREPFLLVDFLQVLIFVLAKSLNIQ